MMSLHVATSSLAALARTLFISMPGTIDMSANT